MRCAFPAIVLAALLIPAHAGPVLDDILNYAVIDQSCGTKDTCLDLTPESPVGQTFTTGDNIQDIFRITVRLDQSPDQWQSGEAVTLTLWDSPSKTRRLAEYALDDVTVKNLLDENPFYVRAPAESRASFYFELTHNGKGDGKATVYASSKDGYPGGQAYVGGKAQDSDLYFEVLVKRKADHETLMQDLFADLDLDAPGIGKVKDAVSSKDWERAIRETVKHFDARPLSQWHDPKAIPKKNPEAKLDAAEKALKHLVEHEGQDFNLGPRINWWANPLPGTGNPAERLCNWGLPRTLGYAYMNSGDERYAKKADEFYVTWMLDNPPPVKPDIDWNNTAYSGLQIARKLGGNAWYFYGELMKSPNLLTDTRMAFIHFQVRLCQLLYSGIGTDGRGWGGNWGFQTYDALLDNALDNPEYREWRKWTSYAVDKLIALSYESLCADGVLNEAAPNYHGMCARRLKSLLQRSKEKNISIPPDLRDTVGRMYTFMAYLTQPDGTTPMFGDSDSESYAEELLEVAKMLGRPDMEYVATQGKKGKAPSPTSAAFPPSGYYFMRSAFPLPLEGGGQGEGAAFEDARYLALHNANWSGTHGHFDLTASVVYAYGRPLLVDPGRYEYSKEHDWFWVAKAHNVILMDDRNYEDYNHTTEYSHWASTHLMDYFDGRNHFYKDTTSDREIVFVKPDYWLVTDQVYAPGEHKLDQYWHFAPGQVEVEDASKTACTSFLTGGNLCVMPILREGLTPRKEDGFVAFKSGVRETAPVIVYQKQASGSASFATLLYPWKVEQGRSALSVRSLLASRTPGVYAFSVTTFRGTDYIGICRRRDDEIGRVWTEDFSSTARASVVRTDVHGTPVSLSWIEGSELRLGDRVLARSERRIGTLDVEYNEKVLRISCREEDPSLEVYSAKCTSMTVNGLKARDVKPNEMIEPFAGRPAHIIVDDADRGFSRMQSNEWTPMPDGDPIGISYYAHETDVGRGEWAEWKGVLPANGEYSIEVYVPRSILPLSRQVEYTVQGQTVSVDQQTNAGKWVSLGRYSLNAGDAVVRAVNASREDGKHFAADAVRFVKTR